MPKGSIFFVFILFIFFSQLPAQPKRELRGVWITSQYNLDWPSKPGLSSEEQKRELRAIFDRLRTQNFNAVFLQIRGAGDALYPSAYVPWSKVLSGQAGLPPSPLYDPLSFALEEAKARKIEFHAWMNPFRIDQTIKPKESYPLQHIYQEHPEWCLQYGGKLYLDPGIPQARNYLVEVVAEVARQYEVDGIHFDDYFYPYPADSKPFPDTASFLAFNPDSLSLDVWRRDNINSFIEAVRDVLIDINDEIQFGVSPFGVWRNKGDDDRGSDTKAGIRSYDILHADVLYWIEQGWLDYVVPQIYFSTKLSTANYKVLLDWWESQHGGADLYIGHALYKVGNNFDGQWNDPRELGRQIELARKQSMGSILFRYNFLPQNPLGITDSLKKSIFASPALLPEKDNLAPKPLFPIVLDAKSKKAGIRLDWEQQRKKGDYYAVYRQEGKKVSEDPGTQIFSLHTDPDNIWVDSTARLLKKYHYQLTHLDQYHQESSPTYVVSLRHRWGWTAWWRRLIGKGK